MERDLALSGRGAVFGASGAGGAGALVSSPGSVVASRWARRARAAGRPGILAAAFPAPAMPRPWPPDDRADRRLEELLERYGRLLSATLRRVCPRDLGIDTQDLEQEARVRLWRTLSRAPADAGTAQGEVATEAAPNPSYIYKVATSVAIDAIRAATARRDSRSLAGPERAEGAGGDDARGAGEAREPAEPPGRSPEDRARRRQVASAIEAGLAQLPAARQRAVRLHLWGLSSPEISRRTGWSETKTRSLISRGLAELRRRLTERGVDRDAGS